MDMVSLTAAARPADQVAKLLRKAGKVPCILYGNDVDNSLLQCEYNEIYKAYASAGKSTLVDLDTGPKKVPVLFQDLAFDPVSNQIIHVDFFAVDMKKEIEAKIPISFEGEAPAKDLGGILLTPHDQVTVKCLPTALPHSLSVSVESLIEFGSALTVADVSIPDGVTVLDDPDVVIATIQEPREEEVIEEAPVEGEEEAAVEGEAVEGEGEGGEEGEKKESEGEGGEAKKEDS